MFEKNLHLDEKDKKILLALETNARQSNAKIAKIVGLSKEVVNYRIKKYLSTGLITRFIIIPNFDLLGFKTYRLYVQFQLTTPQIEEEICNYICNSMCCEWLGVCDGRWNVMARFAAKDIFGFNNSLCIFREKYGKYVRLLEVTTQLRHTWWPSTFGLTEKPPEKRPLHLIPQNQYAADYDKIDLIILNELMENARIPTTQISQNINLSPDAVNYRIKKLLKTGVITQIKSYFNREKIGVLHCQVFVLLNQDPKEIARLIAFLNALPDCFFISSVVGAWDMQFGLDATDLNEFHKLFAAIKEEFPNVMREYESLIVYREYTPNPFKQIISKYVVKK